MLKNYELRSYDIVDGEVNDVYVQGNLDIETTISDADYSAEPSDDQIIDALKTFGFLNLSVDASMLEMDGDDQVIYIDNAKNGEPFCELRLNVS